MSDVSADIKEFVADIDNRITQLKAENERLREIEEAAKNAGIDDMIQVVKFMRDNFDHNSENLKVIFNTLRRLAKLKLLLEKK